MSLTDVFKKFNSWSDLKVLVLGTKEAPTLLSRTFGKAAEWVVIACAVIFLLAVLSSCENSARQYSSVAMRAPLSLYSSVSSSLAGPEVKEVKKPTKVCK